MTNNFLNPKDNILEANISLSGEQALYDAKYAAQKADQLVTEAQRKIESRDTGYREELMVGQDSKDETQEEEKEDVASTPVIVSLKQTGQTLFEKIIAAEHYVVDSVFQTKDPIVEKLTGVGQYFEAQGQTVSKENASGKKVPGGWISDKNGSLQF